MKMRLRAEVEEKKMQLRAELEAEMMQRRVWLEAETMQQARGTRSKDAATWPGDGPGKGRLGQD